MTMPYYRSVGEVPRRRHSQFRRADGRPYAEELVEPVVKRFHAPPAMLETFSGPGWVVCSFTPRPTDFDRESVPAPYAHAAVDCDEMMLFVSGDYAIRKGTNVGVGSMTFHPAGWVHGPLPAAPRLPSASRATRSTPS
jgi:homogentisate 1,2-dioxygenase